MPALIRFAPEDCKARGSTAAALARGYESRASGESTARPLTHPTRVVLTLPEIAIVTLYAPPELEMVIEAMSETVPCGWKTGLLLARTATPGSEAVLAVRQIFAASS